MAEKLNFKAWCGTRRKTRSTSWHFLRDVVLDDEFPNVTEWDDLESYLATCGACDAARASAQAWWRLYLKYLQEPKSALPRPRPSSYWL